MKTGLLIMLGMTVAILVFISLGLLFYKLLPPAEPLLPLHKPFSTIEKKRNSEKKKIYRATFLTSVPLRA